MKKGEGKKEGKKGLKIGRKHEGRYKPPPKEKKMKK